MTMLEVLTRSSQYRHCEERAKPATRQSRNESDPINNQSIVNHQIFHNLQELPFVGEKLAQVLSRMVNGDRIVDLLYHQPSNVLQKRFLPPLYEIRSKEIIITKVKVESHLQPARKSQPTRIICFSPTGYLTLVFFKTFPGYIEKNFPIGAEIVVSGTAERFNDELQMVHPDYVFPASAIDKIPKIEVIYPSINNINQKFIRSKIASALEKIDPKKFGEFPEWINKNLLKQQNWPAWNQAIFNLHNPNNSEASGPNNLSRKRLVFDELFASQIANLIAKKHLKNKSGTMLKPTNILREKLIASLPFQLTKGQKKVLAEIDGDLSENKKMLRLLQGDVGSGKTVLALLAMLLAVENKKQAAIICPITLLAIQHHKNFQIFAEKLGIKIAILTSKTTKKNKEKILDDLKEGEIDILVGTHALLEPDVIFKDLALIVIDEQHRFGVAQRMRLVEKGNNANILLMSATPIPRSLMMTFYGDMDISILDEKPKNRTAIDTRVISQNKDQEILQSISHSLENGEKIYWICPLIEKAEIEDEENLSDTDLSNVTHRFEEFQKKFGVEKVGIIHGKMKEKEKDQIMNEFVSGDLQILVATTVIEVGIDVSDATIIVIENCENFGLSQLHQLRGRVGRGDKKSYCLLLYGKKISHNGKKRLEIMKNSNDGFFIAEEDLKLRGSGEMIGTKQSGLPEYKIANLDYDLELLGIANRHAQFTLENANGKIDKEALRILLGIFGYDECLKLVFGG
ncbi:MAG: recG [Rickettsiaceae bacterium]|jgi:ATP-dependent DNA helicase RecG|nr:recG [Rickettsiaceae bacterium]